MAGDCSQNIDPLKLVREGASQDSRAPVALDPARAPVNEHSVAHNILFARDFAALLKYFDASKPQPVDWVPFFGTDVSVLLAIAAIESVDSYRGTVQSWFDFLNNLENKNKTAKLRNYLADLYAAIGTLARALDMLKESLPPEISLKATLQNLIKTHLAPAFKRLIAYYRAGARPPEGVASPPGLIRFVAPSPSVKILQTPVVSFADTLTAGLSPDWSEGAAWGAYVRGITPDSSVYGSERSVFLRINHCATHALFRSVFDQFLKVFARATSESKRAFDGTLTQWNKHDPHYALFLSALRLLEYARTAGNALTERHLDFYYRRILCLAEKPAKPGHVHLLAELAKPVERHDFQSGILFKAGKDSLGKDAFFANLADFVANKAKVTSLRSLYRHGSEPVGSGGLDDGRIFASPVANSDDGLGAPLTSADQSWEPFYNKVYADGVLAAIRMPKAEIGFAIASHYLLMAEGTRLIILEIRVSGYTGASMGIDFKDDIRCRLSTKKGWLEKEALLFTPVSANTFFLCILVDGADPPVVPYSRRVHGYTFETDLPVLLVTLRQDEVRPYAYPALQDVVVTGVTVNLWVGGLKSLAVSNDFGPLDPSKPFQPFGASPVRGSSLVIGSKEIFQKSLSSASIEIEWQTAPSAYPPTSQLPQVSFEFLSGGQWTPTAIAQASVAASRFSLDSDLDKPVLDEPDSSGNEIYSTESRQGFVKLKLQADFGQDMYQADLIRSLRPGAKTTAPGKPPAGPTASALTMAYSARSRLVLDSSAADAYENRPGQFFHLGPFGTAERHPYLSAGGDVPLLPQFEFVRGAAPLQSQAELYIGVSDLAPPQNLSLLFHVAEGTANPLVEKPKPHIDWCYLRDDEWVEFESSAVQDGTDEFLNSGILTLSIPRDATADNTLLDSGQFWIRAAVHEKSDAVCKLQRVAAQVMEAAFSDQENAPDFSATPLPAGTISKLDKPVSAVKSISQPFSSFGGRGAEQRQAFYTRVSERLRHKDRAIDLWDYEHLILEAFPQIYKVKCLNHTCFEPAPGGGIYRELAPGHVTIVTIPKLQLQAERDPLKPFTSLGVLQEIEDFLKKRTGCFPRLHVKNPQFEEVRVSFRLRLHPGFDESYYTLFLKQTLTRFLSPWAFTEGGTPSFGGKVYKSVLIKLVEDLPYVDYVTDFQIFQDINGQSGTVDLDEVAGSRAVSILVSAPAGKHAISIINAAEASSPAESCGCNR